MAKYTDSQVKEYAMQLKEAGDAIFTAVGKCEVVMWNEITDAIEKDPAFMLDVVSEFLKVTGCEHAETELEIEYVQSIREYESSFLENFSEIADRLNNIIESSVKTQREAV